MISNFNIFGSIITLIAIVLVIYILRKLVLFLRK